MHLPKRGDRTILIEFILIALLASLAVLYTAPRLLGALRDAGVPLMMPASAAALEGIVFSTVGAGLGSSLRAITGFEILGPARSMGTAVIIGILGFLAHLALYYGVFRPRMPERSVVLSERVRRSMGLPARLLQGGIVEEVQFRWGLMSLLAAVGQYFFSIHSRELMIFAIGGSALVFALFHLLGARQIGMGSDRWDAALIGVTNTWGGIVFGWLFWKYGLVAAMACHAFFHAAWLPIEKKGQRRG